MTFVEIFLNLIAMKKLLFFSLFISFKMFGQTPKMEVIATTSETTSGIRSILKNTSPSLSYSAIIGLNNSTNSNGFGVTGEHAGSGIGVYGRSSGGTGVYGFSQFGTGTSGVYGLAYGAGSNGVRGYSENGYGNGVYGSAESGIGVYGHALNFFGTTGIGGYFSNASSTGYSLVTGIGKVGIGATPNLNVDERLDLNGRLRIRHEASTAGVWFNNSANSINYLDGAFHGMLNNTNTGIFIGGAWRFWVNNTGNMGITGFTQLGNNTPAGADASKTAPAIKTMKLTGTTSSASGAGVFLAHGLANASKVLSYSVLVYGNALSVFPPEYTYNTGYQYSTYCSNTSIHILNSVGNSSNILNKTFTVLITYEE